MKTIRERIGDAIDDVEREIGPDDRHIVDLVRERVMAVFPKKGGSVTTYEDRQTYQAWKAEQERREREKDFDPDEDAEVMGI